jgi:hypothetical protein
MKTTLEIPDGLCRPAGDQPWMKAFGKLNGLRAETERIQRVIDDEFGRIDPEDWS